MWNLLIVAGAMLWYSSCALACGANAKGEDICACCFVESLQSEGMESISELLFSFVLPRKREECNVPEVFDCFCSGIERAFKVLCKREGEIGIIGEASAFLVHKYPEFKWKAEEKAEMLPALTEPLNPKCAFATFLAAVQNNHSTFAMSSMMRIFERLIRNIPIDLRERAFLLERERFIYYSVIQKYPTQEMPALNRQKLLSTLDTRQHKVRNQARILIFTNCFFLGCILALFRSMSVALCNKGLI